MRRFQPEVIQSRQQQALLGLYAAAIFIIIYLPVQQLSITQWNLLSKAQIVLNGIHWPQYLAAFIVFIGVTLMPYILGKYDIAHVRSIGTMVFYCLICIPSYLLGSPDNLPWASWWEYHSIGLVLLIMFGGLLGVIAGLYANPKISTSLTKPADITNLTLQQARWQLIREDQERWWKGLSLFVPVILALMVTGGIAWASLPVSEEIATNSIPTYTSARTG
jgi:hypothetical protein